LRTFKHNDPEDLKRVLEREGVRANGKQGASKHAGPLALVAVESLYSMDGDVAPLKELYGLSHAAGALLLVDEAHATGVLGPGGRGALAECFAHDLPADVLAMGTLSKALGSQGGFLCCAAAVRDAIVHGGRAFLFSTGLTPAAAAAAREALLLAEADEPRRLALLRRADDLRAALREKGWKVLGGPGPIVPILVGGESEAVALAERLLLAGVWAPAVRYPTVKKGQARLRVSVSAAHADQDIERLVAALGGK
ncbi:MAG: aminotransferase class I/II-fold pyridoxal phosphate-dependent enzyme, partial [Planctomycetota bacterium]|nr:aminotransferase class I/II-fold pyridoxal phosphate-dependent enzyme [Planctomycetota bacterium]